MRFCAIILPELKEGKLLPSMRQLAKDLDISVSTTKRAYEELEKNESNRKKLFVAIQNGKELGMDLAELKEIMTLLLLLLF